MDIMFRFCKKLCVFFILPTLFWSSAAYFTQKVSNISACAGQDKLLSWRYDSQAVVHVLWSKDGSRFMIQNGLNPTIYTDNTNKYEHITNGEVKLHNLTTKDTGLYKIEIVREGGFGTHTISDEAYLTVIEAPSLPIYTTKNATNGRRFDCLVQALGSPVDIFAKLAGIMLSSPSVTVDMAKPVDCCVTGEAVACLAENTNNESSFCINVFTPGSLASIDGQHQKVFAVLSKSHVLKASVSGYPPPQTFVWYRKAQGIWTRMFSSSKFLIETVGLHSNLTLINVTAEEFGDYGVKAYNGQEDNNLFTKRFSVYKEGTPERPVDFRCHIFSNRTGSVVVEWEQGQNGGFLQTFVIQYRKEGDSQWKEHKVVENTEENNSMTAVLDELLANSVYKVRMYSTNVVGKSLVTSEHLVRTRGDGGPVTETCAWAGATAGGTLGGLVVGSMITVAGLLMYQRFKDAGDKNMRHTKRSDKAKETAGVDYNVVEEKLADHRTTTTTNETSVTVQRNNLTVSARKKKITHDDVTLVQFEDLLLQKEKLAEQIKHYKLLNMKLEREIE